MPLGILIVALLLSVFVTRLILLPIDLLPWLHLPGWLGMVGLLLLTAWLLEE